ncbi:TetR family transcriptional regulator [Isoptericola sp. CG 20/1183]|uniref:TetR family transcriptional regulator n=1 Tax=Isoptericola halotolerans TaxID=300560 RepID=A0ABX5EHK7_9MICO|nr:MULTISPECIES: TetR/AcrR family transcriptional regulator [Isoptericola]PRZ02489.1 TetR family transcriptional regulator [Isoptericola sp. CG 20/1183]PRZ09953.1 TetR family transcriptional regulator [Isoptericola halotolerans]
MPRATAAAAAETARRLVEIAADLFAERGYAAVALDDVATAGGVTRGAVYHHYGSKAGLFRAVTAHLQREVAATLVEAAEAAGGPADRLRAGSHAFLDAITAPRMVRILLVEAPAVVGWQVWRALDAESSAVHLREALAEAGVPAALLDALTAQLSGAMNEAALWLAERDGDAEAREAAHRALDVLLDAVAPPP